MQSFKPGELIGMMKKGGKHMKRAAKIAGIKHTGSFHGKSNALGHGGRAAQLKAQGKSGALIGYLARQAQAAPGQKNFHGKKAKKAISKPEMMALKKAKKQKGSSKLIGSKQEKKQLEAKHFKGKKHKGGNALIGTVMESKERDAKRYKKGSKKKVSMEGCV